MSVAAGPTDPEQALAAAHRKLLAAKDLQFDFVAYREPPPPDWLLPLLKALGQAFSAVAPVLKYVFWGGLILCVVLIAWFVLRDLVRIRAERRAPPVNLSVGPAPWRPARETAQALLSDADALAAEGRFAEAAHLILVRSVDDFAGRRPGAMRPALTSRDLARLDAMPAEARRAFALIAEVVERSLFGGRSVDADRFAECRRAYHDFALAERWA
ncbi:MAG TPA: DUF4129 domain-containing protein [Phenylobacterium sp.]|nr:DUF4129 domain-containing protein [Phenylobacterium sp.]